MSLMAAEKGVPSPTERYPFGELVLERKTALRLSYETLAERCIDPETGEQTVKGSWLHRAATFQNVIPPDPPALRGMAAGFEIPLRAIQEAAAAQFFGMDAVYSPDGEVRAMVHHLEEMSPEDRRRINALIEAYRQG
jgi:hypothetical protein